MPSIWLWGGFGWLRPSELHTIHLVSGIQISVSLFLKAQFPGKPQVHQLTTINPEFLLRFKGFHPAPTQDLLDFTHLTQDHLPGGP
jgi:hypothetical protein